MLTQNEVTKIRSALENDYCTLTSHTAISVYLKTPLTPAQAVVSDKQGSVVVEILDDVRDDTAYEEIKRVLSPVLKRLNSNRNRRSRSDIMRSHGMKRYAHGWE